MKLLNNIIFYVLFLVFSAIYIPIVSVFVAMIRILSSQRIALKIFRKAISYYGKMIIFVLPRYFIKVCFKDFSSNEKGPFVYVINHRASSDAFLLACLDGEIVQVVNKWPFKLPVLGVYAKWAGYLNVREMTFDKFSDSCSNFLGQGCSIAAFPEGTRSGDKTVGQFHGAIFRVAQANQAKIVPVIIMGNEDKPGRGSFNLNAGKIHVHRLPSIGYNDYKGMNSFKLKKYMRNLMSNYIDTNEQNI